MGPMLPPITEKLWLRGLQQFRTNDDIYDRTYTCY